MMTIFRIIFGIEEDENKRFKKFMEEYKKRRRLSDKLEAAIKDEYHKIKSS